MKSIKSIKIDFPSSINIDEKEARLYLASKLYEIGKLSLDQAAQLVGYTREKFMELLADYGISFYNYFSDDEESSGFAPDEV